VKRCRSPSAAGRGFFDCDAHLEYARLASAEAARDQARGHVDAARLVDALPAAAATDVEELEAQAH
jgi:hypothetical protein